MGSMTAGQTVIAVVPAAVGTSPAQRDVCSARIGVLTLKSRTVWFPVLHGRGFL
jgi:hypothetical protein